MRNQVIAKRYAKALFNLALESGQVEQYGQELDDFVRLLKELPNFADGIQNPLYPAAVRKSLFYAVAGSTGMTPIMKSFVNLLVEKRRVAHVADMADYYHKLIDENTNVARAQVKAAAALDEKVLQEIAQTLEKMTGKKVVIEFQKDPTLIGGLVAQMGDLVLDGSVRRQLLGFKESLKRGAIG